MDLSLDIIDHIFSFLRSHPNSLIACSEAHPNFSLIAERHQFYHIVIHTGFTEFAYSFKPTCLVELISKTPRIVNHVRVLQIEFNSNYRSRDLITPGPLLEDIALVLSRFPLIECFMLSTMNTELTWQNLPQGFRTAVEDCLHLPTLQEAHLGDLEFPSSPLDHNTNFFSLTGDSQIPECSDPDTTYPQLKTLSVKRTDNRLRIWAKRCIGNLQSLECHHYEACTELLEACSDTLQNLHIGLWDKDCKLSSCYRGMPSF